jgi:hypothetical protein
VIIAWAIYASTALGASIAVIPNQPVFPTEAACKQHLTLAPIRLPIGTTPICFPRIYTEEELEQEQVVQ